MKSSQRIKVCASLSFEIIDSDVSADYGVLIDLDQI